MTELSSRWRPWRSYATQYLWTALACGGVGLFVAGALTAKLTSQTWWWAGIRQLVLGGLAAGATYGIGHLIGVSV